MNGIKRLRNLAKNEMGFGFRGAHDVLTSIADQIEREALAPFSRVRVLSVITDMERHVSGHEGAEDSPVARWARQLRRALFDEPFDGHADDVSMSAYDILPQEEREAIAWVREHGGIAYVKDAWNVRSNLGRQLGKAQTKVEREKRHIEYLQVKLSERRDKINVMRVQMAEMRPRLVPEGMEWPRFEDGEMVLVGSVMADELGEAHEVTSIEFFEDGVAIRWNPDEPEEFVWLKHGDRVKRPAPKVLDADGVEICEGDTVYLLPGKWCNEWPLYRCHEWDDMEVLNLSPNHDSGRIECKTLAKAVMCYPYPSQLTHRAPALAADGRPLREGEKPYRVDNGKQVEVRRIDPSYGGSCAFVGVDGMSCGYWLRPDLLTHERPDSYDALWDDLENCAIGYSEFIRRVKALVGSDS